MPKSAHGLERTPFFRACLLASATDTARDSVTDWAQQLAMSLGADSIDASLLGRVGLLRTGRVGLDVGR